MGENQQVQRVNEIIYNQELEFENKKKVEKNKRRLFHARGQQYHPRIITPLRNES
jgi:hypothetical protein